MGDAAAERHARPWTCRSCTRNMSARRPSARATNRAASLCGAVRRRRATGDVALAALRSSTVRSRSAASPSAARRGLTVWRPAARAASSESQRHDVPTAERRVPPRWPSASGGGAGARPPPPSARPRVHRSEPGAVVAAHELRVARQLGQGGRDLRPARPDHSPISRCESTSGTAMPSRATRPQRSARCQNSASRRRSTRLSWEIACVTASRWARSESRSTITAPTRKAAERDGGPAVDQREPTLESAFQRIVTARAEGRRCARAGGCRRGRAALC